MKIQGRQDYSRPFETIVFVSGQRLYPDYSLKVYNHSPSGFQWGYSGSGPAQLALALLLLVTDEETAVRLHQNFKRDIIVPLPKDEEFDIDVDLETWVAARGGKVDRNNWIKGFEGKNEDQGECSFPERCQQANWKQCDCSCGGVNHGIQSKIF